MLDREKRILVVDDDAAIRSLIFTIMRRRGFAVDAASNGEEAIAQCMRCNYAVMLLDLMMPVKNGWDVLKWIEEQPPETRPLVIVLTAGSEPRTMNSNIVAGTVRKPFDIALLVDMVTACIRALREHPQRDGCPPPQSREPFQRDVN